MKLVDAAGNEQAELRRTYDPQPLCLPRLSQRAGDHRARSSSTAGCAPATCSSAMRDGFYYFRSRVDDMFSCGGENIYPKEVENLLFTHPDVADAVVAPVPHAVKGFVPAAMVTLRAGAHGDAGRAQGLLPRARPALLASPPHRACPRCRRTAPARSTAPRCGANCRRTPRWQPTLPEGAASPSSSFRGARSANPESRAAVQQSAGFRVRPAAAPE